MVAVGTKQIEAIKLQQTWCIWLTTAQLALLAAIGIDKVSGPCMTKGATTLLCGISFSCASIIAASVLASAHPSMLLRITEQTTGLDMDLWDVRPYRGWHSDWIMALVEHYAFVGAVVCYGIYLFKRLH